MQELDFLSSSGREDFKSQIDMARAAARGEPRALPRVARRGWTFEEIFQACLALFLTKSKLPTIEISETHSTGFGLASLRNSAVEGHASRQDCETLFRNEPAEPARTRQDIQGERQRIAARVKLLRCIEAACESIVEHDELRAWLVKEMPAECKLLVTTLLGKSTLQRNDCRNALQRCSPKKLGNRLREVRRQRGLSQSDLAKMARTHKQNVSDHEAGLHKPRLPTIEAYAAALKVQPRQLIPG